MKDIRQSKEYANYLKSQNWIIEKIGKDYVFVKKILFFSFIKFQRPNSLDTLKLFKLARKYRAVYIIFEPLEKIKGFKQIKPYLPAKTLVLDLKKSQNKLLEEMHKDARYALRKNENKKLKFQKDLVKFQSSWKDAASRGRYILSLKQLKTYKKAFGNKMLLLQNEKETSGAMFLIANNVGYYWYGFTSNSARASLIQYKIIWEGIKWAKKSGAKHFDFEGIYDKRWPDKGWLGFSKFKKKFGGKEVEFPGAYSKWRLPF